MKAKVTGIFLLGAQKEGRNYYEDVEDVVNYIQTVWLPHKIHWFKAWTNQITLFKHTSSSRAESAHHYIRSFVKYSTENFYM